MPQNLTYNLKVYITDYDEVKKSFLAVKEGCVCPGHNLTLECTVVTTATQGGITVWNGTSFDCANSNNVIILLHNGFLTNKSHGVCSNGSIMAQIIEVNSENTTYTSQLNVTINPDTLGQNISCHYDDNNNMTSTVGSIKLTWKGNLAIAIYHLCYVSTLNYWLAAIVLKQHSLIQDLVVSTIQS